MPMPRRPSDSDSGSATAETAVVLPALAVVLLLSLWSVAAVTAQLRCVDAARTAARALARGESGPASAAAAREAAPDGARVAVTRSGDTVLVEVTAVAGFPGPWSGSLPALRLSGRAAAVLEAPSAVRPAGSGWWP
jgi:hypothetical protein